MGELYEPFPKLPKNIRQLGERDQVLKLYVEDYVNTYLKRLRPAKGASLRVGLLLGSREVHEDMPYVFVDGALEMEAVEVEGENVTFTEDAWKRAYQDVEKQFPKRTVQGWFLCGTPGCALSPLTYWRQHSQYFLGKNQLMYLNSGMEGEEAVYIASADGFYKLRGYNIYYERNQMMQDYMVLRKETPRTEKGVDDKAIQSFRERMEKNQCEAVKTRSTIGVLSGLCGVLAVTVLAGGVAMFNNYQKLRRMESVIASVTPGGAGREADRGDYTIEEARGRVYPTAAQEAKGEAETGTDALQSTENQPEAPAASADATAASAGSADASADASAGSADAPSETSGEDSTEASADGTYHIYTVSEGETLFGICYKLYQNVNHIDEICRANQLKSQDSIYAGQRLLVP